MPEFVMDRGTSDKEFRALDAFTQGYIECAFFTESGEEDSPCEGASFDDLHPDTLQAMIDDCRDFQELAKRSLDLAYDYATRAYDESQAGHDFWLTRNGHGAGFWDRGLGAVGDKLTKDAKTFGAADLYLGDDGFIHQG